LGWTTRALSRASQTEKAVAASEKSLFEDFQKTLHHPKDILFGKVHNLGFKLMVVIFGMSRIALYPLPHIN
jgi:hypothetical protein